MEFRLVLCTFPDVEKARQIGTVLVTEQLAACVNLLPQAESIYRWKGEIEHDKEVLALFKTSRQTYPKLEARLIALHPYETPECLALDVADGSADYLAWLGDSLAR